jgi:ribosomal-protein-alanine N-acetyltransferase
MELPTLTTARLVLRPYSLPDVADLVRLAGAREVAATTLRIPHPYHEQDALDFIASCRADAELGLSARLAITLRESGELCGGIGLRINSVHHRAELGYWLGVPYWRRGYATEAARAVVEYGFGALGLNRIYASLVSGNRASGRVLEKVGMRYEGCLRSHLCKWDVFHDLEFYGILRSDLLER